MTDEQKTRHIRFIQGFVLGTLLFGGLAIYIARAYENTAGEFLQAATNSRQAAEKLLACRQEQVANLNVSTVLLSVDQTVTAETMPTGASLAGAILARWLTGKAVTIAPARKLQGAVWIPGKVIPAVSVETGALADYFWCNRETGNCEGPFRAKVF